MFEGLRPEDCAAVTQRKASLWRRVAAGELEVEAEDDNGVVAVAETLAQAWEYLYSYTSVGSMN